MVRVAPDRKSDKEKIGAMTKKLKLTLLLGLAILLLPGQPTKLATALEWTLNVRPTSVRPGEVTMVEITPAAAVKSATLSWEKRRIPLVVLPDSRRMAALLGVPREAAAGPVSAELEIVDRVGRRNRWTVSLQVVAKQFPEQRLTLPQRQVTPDRAAMGRHRAERQTLQKIFADIRQQRLWRAPFQLPVPGKLLSPFGVQRILNGQPRSYHSGVDLRAGFGEPVAAAGDGRVVLAADHFFAGKSVYIDHGMGIVTMYFHLSQIAVKSGQWVESGQLIGRAGASGRASGPHLHWGARVHDCKIDPLALVDLLGSTP